jgi:membrane protein
MAAQTAFNTVYAVPFRDGPNFLLSRRRSLGLLITFGLLQVISTVASGVVSGGFGGIGLLIAGIALSLLLNLVPFFAVFRLLHRSQSSSFF